MSNCKTKNNMISINLKEHSKRPDEYSRKITGYGTAEDILKELNKYLVNDLSGLILNYSKEKNAKVPLLCCKEDEQRPLIVGDIVYKEAEDFELFPYVVIKKGYKYIYTKRLKPEKVKPQKDTGMVKLKYYTDYLKTFPEIYKNLINSNDYILIKNNIITFNTYNDPTAYYEDKSILKQMVAYYDTFF